MKFLYININKQKCIEIPILLLSAFSLRIYNLIGRGFIDHDAVAYWNKVDSFFTDGSDNYFFWYYAKPCHHLLMAVFYLIFGSSPDSALLLSVCAGTLSILFVYLSAYNFCGRYAALASGVLMLFSPLENYYSRIGASQITAILFFSIFIYFLSLLKRNEKKLQWLSLLGGLFLSLSITCHYNAGNWLIVIVPLSIYFYKCERKSVFTNLIFFLFGCFIPLIGFELFFIFQKIYISRPDVLNHDVHKVFNFWTYWEQIIAQIFDAKGGSNVWGEAWSLWRYLTEYIKEDNLVIIILFFLSIIYNLARKDVNVILLLIVPTALYLLIIHSFKASGFIRNIASLIPMIYVISGLIFEEVGKSKKLIKYGVYIIVFSCVIFSSYSGRKLLNCMEIKPLISEEIRKKVVEENAKYLLIPSESNVGVNLINQPFKAKVITNFSEDHPYLDTVRYLQNNPDASQSYTLININGENITDSQIQEGLLEYARMSELKPLKLIASFRIDSSRYVVLVRLSYE